MEGIESIFGGTKMVNEKYRVNEVNYSYFLAFINFLIETFHLRNLKISYSY